MTATKTTRYYSRDEVAQLESHEGDDRQQTWLSPYAIPTELTVGCDDDGLRIDLRYFGEELGVEPRQLDDASPAAMVRFGRYTRKVMAVRIPLPAETVIAMSDPTAAVSLVRSLADRLIATATRRDHPGERLSLHLIGKLLRDITLQMVAIGRPSADLPTTTGRNPNRQNN